MKTVTVDARCLSHLKCDGIFNFLLNALKFIAPERTDVKFVLISNRLFNPLVRDSLEGIDNINFLEDLNSINNSHLWFIFKLPYIIRRIKPAWHWSPAVTFPLFLPGSTKTLITVHDMVYHDYKKTMSLKTKLSSIFFYDYSIKSATQIWAVSEYTKKRIIERYQHLKCDQIIVGSGIDFNKYKNNSELNNSDSIFQRLCIPEKFALFVGTMEPRKNLKFLLEMWNNRSDNLNLVIVGASGWKMNNEIASIVKSKSFRKNNIFFTGYVEDNDLLQLYKLCSIFISTSFNEGFGLPMLEALATGKAVIASNNSAISEVVGKSGILVNGWDINTWNDAVDLILNNPPTINEKLLNEKFNWNFIKYNLKESLWRF